MTKQTLKRNMYSQLGQPATAVLLAVMVMAMVSAACASDTDEWYTVNDCPDWSPDGTRIVFSSNAESLASQVWVINANGTGLCRLSTGDSQDMNPVWSTDGTHIYFIRYNDEGKGNIWSMHANGTDPAALTTSSYSEYSCDASPDGAHLVVSSERGIYTYSTSGTAQTCIAASGDDDEPSYSPAGDKITFVRSNNIWIRSLDKTGLARLTTGDYFESTPRWSPDGTKILFGSDRDGSRRIWRVSPDGTNLQRVFTDDNEPEDVSDANPCWSPNGSKIAFRRDDGASCEIWTANADGTGLAQVTHTASNPTFTPAAGTYSGTQSVSIASATAGTTIRYTTDGSEPTDSSDVYSAPIAISSAMTLKAKAWKTEFFPSNTGTAEYVIQ